MTPQHVPLTVRPSSIAGWWNIIRAKHDGRTWSEHIGRSTTAWCMSERLEPWTCVEGPDYEICDIARGILDGHDVAHKRCAAARAGGGWRIYSPRNTDEDRALIVTAECAEALARHILEVVPNTAERVTALEDAGSIVTVNTAHLNAKEST